MLLAELREQSSYLKKGGRYMKKTICAMLSLIMFLGIAVTACGRTEQTSSSSNSRNRRNKEVKVGFLYIGPINDGGWTYSHDQGRLFMEKELGVKTIYKENVPVTHDSEKVMNDMIAQGCNVIVGTSLGYMDYMEEVSKNNLNVIFLNCAGYKTAANMSNFSGRMEQPGYLSGIVAGMKTKTNKIGYVASYEIPEVIRGIDAFTLGVRSVKPDAVVKVKWTHTWYDLSKEKEAAKSLLDQGADVIAQHQYTSGVQQAAVEKGAFSIGYGSDMKDKAPKSYMTAPIWDWGPYYVRTIKLIMDGTWKSESYWAGMESGIVKLADLTENAPKGAKEAVEKAKQDILSGKLSIFAGPIKDQNGKIRVSEGQEMSDSELIKCNWFVQGVEGETSK